MIVKVRRESDKYNQSKGEVVGIDGANKIKVKFEASKETRYYDERDLQKVIPQMGGRIYIISKG